MRRNKAEGAKRPQQLPTIAVFERLGVWEPAFPREFSWRNGGGRYHTHSMSSYGLGQRPYGKCRLNGKCQVKDETTLIVKGQPSLSAFPQCNLMRQEIVRCGSLVR